jgi:hypothetical protein
VTRLKLQGKRPLVLSRFSSEKPTGGSSSLADDFPSYEEILKDGIRRLPLVPCYSNERVKGFAAFFTPPILDGEDRQFRSSTRIMREYESTLGNGEDDQIVCTIDQVAQSHILKFRCRLEIDASLPAGAHSESLRTFQRKNDTSLGDRIHRVWEGSSGPLSVVGTQAFSITLVSEGACQERPQALR